MSADVGGSFRGPDPNGLPSGNNVLHAGRFLLSGSPLAPLTAARKATAKKRRFNTRIITTEDVHGQAKGLGIPASTTSWALNELVRSGWIERAKRRLHLVDETRQGGPKPHPFAIATALVEPSAISHWSAFSHHGFTEQEPRIVTASTPKDIVTPRMRRKTPDHLEPASTWEVAGITIRYIRLSAERFWGFDQVWVDEFHCVAITDRERTILDGFVSPEVFGSHEVLGVLEEHLAEIDLPRIVHYTLRYGQGATIKRLGDALERLGVPADVLCPLRDASIRGYRLLDPQGPVRGLHSSTWHVRDNLMVEQLNAS